jgi:hypothetical protein
MRVGTTLIRKASKWSLRFDPATPLSDQLADFKRRKVAGDFGADEVLVLSGSGKERHFTVKGNINIQKESIK